MLAYLLFVISYGTCPPDWVPDSRYPEVRLTDIREFGVSGPAAKSLWQMSCVYRREQAAKVQTWLQPKDYFRWEREWQFCHDCWDMLDNAMNGHWCTAEESRERRLYWLNKLRQRLGDDLYRARIMPPHAPFYLFE